MRQLLGSDPPLQLERVIDIDLDGQDVDRGNIDLSSIHDLRFIYGNDVPHEWLTESTGASYPHLIAFAHDALVREGLADSIRTIVLAIASPDSQHRRLLGGFTTQLFATRPNTFAVTEQGAAGPFTALALARLHLEADLTGADRAAVLILEQRTLPPAGVPVPTADRAIVLVVGRNRVGRTITEIGVRRGVDDASAVATHPDRSLLVAGLQVDHRGSSTQRALRPGGPTVSTGVWQVLAGTGDLPGTAEHPIHVVEVDPDLGYTCELRLSSTVTSDNPAINDLARQEVL